MLQNVTLLAIVAIHTAANEPPKVCQVMNKIHQRAKHAVVRGLDAEALDAAAEAECVHDAFCAGREPP